MRRWNPSELLNGQFLKFTGSSGFTSHQIGVNKIVVQLGTVCIHLQISFKKLYLFNTIASTTLHDCKYETKTLGWRRQKLQIFY
jgi:hypothetical protein